MQLDRLAILGSLALILAAPVFGQEAAEVLEGGSFEVEGRRIEVSAEAIARQVELILRETPAIGRRDLVEAAWIRAIRLGAARALGLEAAPEDFEGFMVRRHAAHAARWTTPEGGLDRAALEAWIRERGFAGTADYEAFCRQEHLAELFVAHELPRPSPPEEERILDRMKVLGTTVSVTALAVSRETVSDAGIAGPEDPELRERYRRWFESLPDRVRLLFDDAEHPALETEVLYVPLRGLGAEEFRAWFEQPRGELGSSIAERTESYEPGPLDRDRIWRRWVEHRRVQLARINADLPTGLNDEESFALVESHLLRIWRTARYLGELWRRLRAGPGPADLEAVARRTGLAHRRIPMTLSATFANDPELPGDHFKPLLDRTEPGEILDYGTRADESPVSPYFAEGVVDQPGLHLSIWKLVAKEPMRVRPADEVVERAWPFFVETLLWYRARERSRDLARRFGELRRDLEARGESNPRARAFETLLAESEETASVAPLILRPHATPKPNPDRGKRLALRLRDLLHRDWEELAGPGAEALAPGHVTRLVLSPDFEAAVVARVDEAVPPRRQRLESDLKLRREALRSLAREDEEAWRERVANAWRWAVVARRFSVETEDLPVPGR